MYVNFFLWASKQSLSCFSPFLPTRRISRNNWRQFPMGMRQEWLPGLKPYLKQLKNKGPSDVCTWPRNTTNSANQTAAKARTCCDNWSSGGGRALGSSHSGLYSTESGQLGVGWGTTRPAILEADPEGPSSVPTWATGWIQRQRELHSNTPSQKVTKLQMKEHVSLQGLQAVISSSNCNSLVEGVPEGGVSSVREGCTLEIYTWCLILLWPE